MEVWDTVSLIIGIVVGSTIFKMSGTIFSSVPGPWWGLGFWILCGGLSLVGALCYAELATTYPRMGGDYNYLTRAFGPCAGFLFGWSELLMIQTGNIGALSYVFAEYAVKVFGFVNSAVVWLALSAVIVLTFLNMLGMRAGKRTQNCLSIAKGIGLVLIIVAGLSRIGQESIPSTVSGNFSGWPTALILILYAYGGWNDAAFVASTVRDPSKNVPRALFLGIGLITGCYLLINLAYLTTLGYDGLCQSHQPAADAMAKVFGRRGEQGISLLVMISALGSVNGLIFSVSRLHATVGTDHRVFALLGTWSKRNDAPVWSLLIQGLIASVMIVGVGTQAGRNLIDSIVRLFRSNPVPWEKYYGGFDTLVAGSAPVFWFFFLATGIAYFVLRVKDREVARPFKAPLFPLCPSLFVTTCLFGVYSATVYGWDLLPLAIFPVVLGIPVYLATRSVESHQVLRSESGE